MPLPPWVRKLELVFRIQVARHAPRPRFVGSLGDFPSFEEIVAQAFPSLLIVSKTISQQIDQHLDAEILVPLLSPNLYLGRIAQDTEPGAVLRVR